MEIFQEKHEGAPPRVGEPRQWKDPGDGFAGWSQQIPGRREVVTPCVDAGRVFLGGGFGSHEFHAFDAATGECLWSRRTSDDGPTAAVAADGHVVFNTESCTVVVLRAESGDRVWEKWLGDPLLAQPAVGGGEVFMAWPAKGDHLLGAFGLCDGAPRWQVPLAADVITAPVFCEGRLYAATLDGDVHCFDAGTGHALWRRSLRATSAPWVWKGEVFVSHRDDRHGRAGAGGAGPAETVAAVREARYRQLGKAKLARYLRSRRGTRAGRLDHSKDAGVGFGQTPLSAKLHIAESLYGATTVSRAWSFQGSRPCVWGERVYSVVGDELSAVSVASGRELWRWSGGSDPDAERTITPPAVTGGRVYAGTRDGRVLSWNAETGALRWSVDVGVPVGWQPVVSGGRVFAGGADGRLVSFETGDAGDDGWPMWGGGPGHNGGDAAVSPRRPAHLKPV